MKKTIVAGVTAAALSLSMTPCVFAAMPVPSPDMQSIATTMAVPDGSRQNPYNMRSGVELPKSLGMASLKLKAVYKGSAAVKKARALTKKSNRSYLNHRLSQKGKRQFVVLKVRIAAVEGYEDGSLRGSSFIPPYGLYNVKATNKIKSVEQLDFDRGRASDIELHGGGSDTAYFGLFLPKSVKSFCVSEYCSGISDLDGTTSSYRWMRYDL